MQKKQEKFIMVKQKSRPIRGESSEKEAKELAEEGIPFSRLPWPAKEDA